MESNKLQQMVEYCELTQKLLFALKVENDKDIDQPEIMARYIEVSHELSNTNFNIATAYAFLNDVKDVLEAVDLLDRLRCSYDG